MQGVCRCRDWEGEGAGSVQVQAPSGVPASTILPPAVVMAANNYYGLPQVPQVTPPYPLLQTTNRLLNVFQPNLNKSHEHKLFYGCQP